MSESTIEKVRNSLVLASPNVGPLAGRHVIVTRAPDRARELLRRLDALGAETTCWVPFEIVPLAVTDEIDRALRACQRGDWIAFTSAAAAQIVAARVTALGLQPPWSLLRVAAIGPATARTLCSVARPADVVARESSGEGLASALGNLRPGTLWHPCSDRATTDLSATLRSKGWTVHRIVVYTLERARWSHERPDAPGGRVDAVVFTSPSAVEITLDEWSQSCGLPSHLPRFVAIGPTTAAALHREQLAADGVAATPAAMDVAEAVLRALRSPAPHDE